MPLKSVFGVALASLLTIALIVIAIATFFSPFTPRSYGVPERTTWTPSGARTLPYRGSIDAPGGGDALGYPISHFRTLHGDSLNTDEIAIAAAPIFEAGWHAEPHTFNTEGPTFDAEGNVYFSPIYSVGEDVMLISLDSDDGSRRWKIEDVHGGGGAPLVLDDPGNPGEQIIYVGSYERVVAVRPNADADGNGVIGSDEVIWDVPTGLTVRPGETAPHVFGLNYDPTTDSVIGLARDNHIYAVDRKSGRQILATHYSIPDIAPSPLREVELPENIRERIEMVARPFLGEANFDNFVGALLGNNSIIANYFSVDPHTGKIWVAATAPDGEDGEVDGVSEFGAVYSLILEKAEGEFYTVDNQFHVSFPGGSASTPALSADGRRVYFGDNFGTLITVDAEDGDVLWKLDVGEQIWGSVSVASDNRELYLSTATGLVKVFDNGDSGEQAWRARLNMYPELGINVNRRALTATITANGIAFLGSSELKFGPGLMVSVGAGLIDRETGAVRFFSEGREDSVSVTSVGPDGAIYIAHSPIKRMFAAAVLGDRTPPITGGVQKYAPIRLDLLIRDAIHAAADRANNVATNGVAWSPDLKAVEAVQIRLLIDQARNASVTALKSAEITDSQWTEIAGELGNAEAALGEMDFSAAYAALKNADQRF